MGRISKTIIRCLAVCALVALLTSPLAAQYQKTQFWCGVGGVKVPVAGTPGSTLAFQQSAPACTVTVYYTGLAGAVTITSVVRASNLVTLTLAQSVATVVPGAALTVAGVGDTSFNGNFTVLTVTGAVVTYAQTAAPASSSGGTGTFTPPLYTNATGTAKANPFTAASNGLAFFYADPGTHYDIVTSGGGLTAPVTLSDVQVNTPPGALVVSAASFSGVDPCAQIQAADDFLGSATGTIVVPASLAGGACASPPVLGKAHTITFLDTATYNVALRLPDSTTDLSATSSVYCLSGATLRLPDNANIALLSMQHWSELVAKSVTTLSRVGNIVTVATSTPHHYTTGDIVYVAGGAKQSFWTVASPVRVVNATTFTYPQTAGNDTDTGGMTGSSYGAFKATITGCNFDGNKANNVSGDGIQLYGLRLNMQNVFIIDAAGDGLHTEAGWDVPENSHLAYDLAANFTNVRSLFNGGNGWIHLGPHDATIVGYNGVGNGGWGWTNGGFNTGDGGNGDGSHIFQMNVWSNTAGAFRAKLSVIATDLATSTGSGDSILLDAGAGSSYLVAPTAATVNPNAIGIHIKNYGNVITGASIVNNAGAGACGIKMDVAGGGGNIIDGHFANDTNAICWEAAGSPGANYITGNIQNGSYTGNTRLVDGPAANDFINIIYGDSTAFVQSPNGGKGTKFAIADTPIGTPQQWTGVNRTVDGSWFAGNPAGGVGQTGDVGIVTGDTTHSGYLILRKPDGSNLGTLGNSDTDALLTLENGATFKITGGTTMPTTLNATTAIQANGTPGMTGTVVVKGSAGTNCNLVFAMGLLTSTTCP